MENKVFIKELDSWVNDDCDFSYMATEQVETEISMYVKDYPESLRELTEDDICPDCTCKEGETCKYKFYTQQACREFDAIMAYWYGVGISYFPDGDIDINPANYREY